MSSSGNGINRLLRKIVSEIEPVGESRTARVCRIFFTLFEQKILKGRYSSIKDGRANNKGGGRDRRRSDKVGIGTLSTPPEILTSPNSSVPVVYCDGCCLRNGSKEAKGGVSVFWADGSPYNVSDPLEGSQTNIRAELEAAKRAVQTAIDQGYPAVEVRTDSLFTIKVATEWSERWQRNGWKTSGGYSVKNQNDVRKLMDLCKRVKVKWTHVSGHSGIPGNEAADALARAAASKQS